MDYTEKKLRRLNTYEGIIINVGLDRVSLPDGSEAFREIVEHPGGACILPVDGEGNAYCVRQYRYPIGEHLLEAPAGKLERGEDPLVCAVRELGEETGFTAGRIVPLGAYHSSPGFSSERLYIYLALDLSRGEAHPDEGEFLDLVKLPFSELLAMVKRGEISDPRRRPSRRCRRSTSSPGSKTCVFLRAMIKLPCIYGQRVTPTPDARQEESTLGKI